MQRRILEAGLDDAERIAAVDELGRLERVERVLRDAVARADAAFAGLHAPRGRPRIGDRVEIGVGAVLVGNIEIGAGAVIGHVFTPWLGFRGGKGVATTIGVCAVLCTRSLLAGLGVDMDVTPRLRWSFNLNSLWFDDTAVLEAARRTLGMPCLEAERVLLQTLAQDMLDTRVPIRVAAAVDQTGRTHPGVPADLPQFDFLGRFRVQ